MSVIFVYDCVLCVVYLLILSSFFFFFFFFSSRRRHTRLQGDWSSDVSDLTEAHAGAVSRDPRGRNRAGLHRQILEDQGRGDVSLRLLRGNAIRFLDEVRFRNGLAEFL